MSSVLDQAERLDGYRAAIRSSPLNAAARDGQRYELASISPAAAAALQNAATEIPLLAGCEIAILHATADSGMPHTRAPNLICLPASMCKEGPLSANFKETLIHEAIHVHQRKHRDLWNSALSAAGWSPVPRCAIPTPLLSRIRINPDTMAEPFWAWNSNAIPLPLFPSIVPTPTLGSAAIEWYDTRTGALFHDPPRGANISETGAAQEHPYELYAYRFSQQGLKTHDDIVKALKGL